MKRTAITLCLLICLMSAFGQTGRLIGSWGPAEKSSVTEDIIVFRPDRTAILNIEGKKLMIDEYILDAQADPMQVELKTQIEGQPASLYLLVEFIQGNSMKMEIFPLGTVSPTKFSVGSTDNQIILTRKP